MRYFFILCFLSSLLLFAQTKDISPEKKEELDNRVEQFVKKLSKQNEEFRTQNKKDIHSKDWVKKKLDHMFMIDQEMRQNSVDVSNDSSYLEQEQSYISQIFYEKYWSKVDYENTEDLKEILAVYGWITISQFGEGADGCAFIIVQHADHDVTFQKAILQKLEKLYPKNETSPKNYAYLYDRVTAIAEKQPQRYGTQGRFVNGSWESITLNSPTCSLVL